MEALKTMASEDCMTIVLTIHQPSARIFQTIDKVIFLSAGHVTFFDEATKLQAYGEKLGRDLKIVSAGGNAPELFLDICDQLSAKGEIEKVFNDTIGHPPSDDGGGTGLSDKIYANSPMQEIFILAKRAFLNILRTPELFAARLVLIFVGFQMGTLFLFTANTDTGLGYRAAFFTFSLATFYWTSLEALPIFFNEREVFMREYSRGAYRASSYTIATWVVGFPALIVLASCYAVMTWWLIGFPPVAERFFFFAFQCFIALLAGQTFATMFSTLLPNPMTAQTVASTIFSVMLVFSGYFITRDNIPEYW